MPPKKRKKWRDDHILDALDKVQDGVSLRAASIEFGVPRKILEARVKGRAVHRSKPGPSTALTSNWALRGHRDRNTDIEYTPDTQHGNFRALLHFRILVRDTVLSNHICPSSRNAMYTSSRIQNEIVNILGK